VCISKLDRRTFGRPWTWHNIKTWSGVLLVNPHVHKIGMGGHNSICAHDKINPNIWVPIGPHHYYLQVQDIHVIKGDYPWKKPNHLQAYRYGELPQVQNTF
jgi:hypothetical protein